MQEEPVNQAPLFDSFAMFIPASNYQATSVPWFQQLFQIADHVRDRIQDIACQDGSGGAEIVCSIEAGLGMDPGTGDRGFVGVEPLGTQADDQAGKHITGPSPGQGG